MFFFFQAEDGIRDLVRSRGLGDVYKRQHQFCITVYPLSDPFCINPGIQEKDNALNFQLYPNPAHDELNLLFEEQDPQATFLAIYNSTGQNVYSEMISSFEKINVSSWPRGLYTIVINAGNKVTAKRVVIQ